MAKVLLVEDDNNLREIYEARLQAEGYEIAAAQDGEQALVVAKDFKPDLVISDVMMPKISGFEMLDILRNTEGLEHTRVIMLTALSQAEDKSRADSLGADRYLVKSQVTLEDIIKAAHDILGDGTEPAAAAPAPPAPAAATDVAVATPPAPTPDPVAPPAPAAATDVPVADAPAEPTPAPVSEPSSPEPVAEAPQTETSETPAPESTPVPTVNAAPTTAEDAIAQAVEVETTPATPAPAPVDSNQAQDDKLLAEAENSLRQSTGTTVNEPASTEATPAAASAETPAPPAPNMNDDTSAGSSKRVIQPISTEDATKPTLEELLAREEAKEISTGSVAPTVADTATPPASSDEATPPPPPGTTTKPGQAADFNPHDISL